MSESHCTSGCRTRDHASYAECLRAKGARVGYANSAAGMDYSTEKRFQADLAHYKDARRQGIQPASTKRDAVDRAVAISEATGTAYDAG